MEYELNELFDSDEVKNYSVMNLNPKSKVPQFWLINAPGNDNLAVKMVSFMSRSDAIKQVKLGDKFAQVFLMSLSKSANGTNLKGGLGSDALGTLNTIFDTVYEQVKKLKMDAVMFRFPAQKMKGQEKTLQRVLARLAMQRTGGKFKVLEELYKFNDSRHSYVLLYRKSKPIEDISGIPGINADLYSKVETKVGDAYISKESGKQVSKLEAIAGSLADVEHKRNEKSIISRSKVSRSVLMKALYGIDKGEGTSEFNDAAKEAFVELQENPPVYISAFAKKSSVTERVNTQFKQRFDRLSNALLNLEDDPDGEFIDDYDDQDTFTELKDVVMNSYMKMTGMSRAQMIMNSDETNEKTKHIYIKLAEVLKSTTDTQTIYKEMIKYMLKIVPSDMSDEKKHDVISGMITNLNTIIYNMVDKEYKTDDDTYGYTERQKEAISSYTTSAYADINQFLLGKKQPHADIYKKIIPELDSAFKNGVQLDKSTILYRAHRLYYKDMNQAVENKMLYFPNYVSTTLKPEVFGLNYQQEEPKETSWEDVAADAIDQKLKDDPEAKEFQLTYNMAITIKGAHKVNAIVTGQLSDFQGEAEVILPRGSALKINEIFSGGKNTTNLLVNTTYIAPEQIEESMELYDGDKFLNEGKLEKLDFSSFMNKKDEPLTEAVSDDDREALRYLADTIDISNLPKKFVD